MKTIVESFLLIFMAELGDKSMLLAMTFATRYPIVPVMIGIFTGILANHGVAVLIGSQTGKLLPVSWIQPLSGLLFLVFAFTGLKTEEEHEKSRNMGKSVIFAVAVTFFIGEFGDKTQLSAMTLASMQPAYLVLIATVSAMMCTSVLSIILGLRIGKKIPEVAMRVVSCLVFLAFGLSKLRDALSFPVWSVVAVLSCGVYLFFAIRFWRAEKYRSISAFAQTAEILKRQRELIEIATERMCLGQNKCGTCAGAACMVGFAKELLHENQSGKLSVDVSGLIRREYDKSLVREGLEIVLRYYKEYGWDADMDSLQNQLRRVFETILYGAPVVFDSFEDYEKKLILLDPKWTEVFDS